MMGKRSYFARSIFIQACLILLLGLAVSAETADWRTVTPLPDDLKIEPPGPGVPPSVARLSGVWQGELACCLPGQPTTLVVEKLTLEGVTTLYSWGEYGEYKFRAVCGHKGAVPGWQRGTGTIQGDSIVLKFGEPPHDSTMYLDTRDGKTLYVKCVDKDGTTRGTFDKKE